MMRERSTVGNDSKLRLKLRRGSASECVHLTVTLQNGKKVLNNKILKCYEIPG